MADDTQETAPIAPDSCWILRDFAAEQGEILLWELELHAYAEQKYDVTLYGPQGLIISFQDFSREAVEYEETRDTDTTRAWHLTTADGTPVSLIWTEGEAFKKHPWCHIWIGGEGHINCELPLPLFQEFSTCMTLPIQEWARRDGWLPRREVDFALIDARQDHASGESRRN
jgi:hypothetical protein